VRGRKASVLAGGGEYDLKYIGSMYEKVINPFFKIARKI
jgi:hypothetical protein